MARPLRVEYPGAVYHITSRGNARQAIFLAETDYSDFLDVLCFVVKRFNWILHTHCLMRNHYHLLIETPEGNLSRGMRQLNGLYVQRFNKKHDRVGHGLQGRYKAILVDKDSYLLELCRYVVLNPVRAGLVNAPQQWQWISYSAIGGYSEGIACLTEDWILLQFGNDREEAVSRYREFVMAGLKEESPWKELKGQVLLGDDSFIEKFKKFLSAKETLKEIPRVQRYITRPPLTKIIKEYKHHDKRLREMDIYEAHIRYGYTLREIAEYLSVHYATISRAVRQAEKEDVKVHYCKT